MNRYNITNSGKAQIAALPRGSLTAEDLVALAAARLLNDMTAPFPTAAEIRRESAGWTEAYGPPAVTRARTDAMVEGAAGVLKGRKFYDGGHAPALLAGHPSRIVRRFYDGGLSPLGQKARAWASKGFRVFPCIPGGKEPLPNSAGHYDATTDSKQIVAWWTAHPAANVAWAPGDDYTVLDFDPKNGGDACDLELKHGLLPDTLTVQTPSGGQHFYYRTDRPLRSTNGTLGRGVDSRGATGYVIIAGTVGGKEYRVTKDLPIAAAPEWLYGAIGEGIERQGSVGDILPGLSWDEPGNVERARRWLLQDAEHGDAARGIGSALETAMVVRDHAVSFEKCLPLMRAWNARVNPPWDDDVLVAKVENAYSYASRAAGERCASPSGLAEMRAKADAGRASAPNGPAPRNRFHMLGHAELMAAAAKPDWLIEDTLVKRSTIEIYGPWGSFKSFVALDMALHLAAGLDWAGHKIASPVKVVYVAGEGQQGMHARYSAWVEAHGGQGAANFKLIKVPPQFAEAEDLKEFIKSVVGFKPALVVFDTFSRSAVGLDENSPKDMAEFFQKVSVIIEQVECAAMIIHHAGKDVSKGSRGSNSIPASCDTVFETVSASKGYATLTMRKQKDWSEWEVAQSFRAKVIADSVVLEPAALQITMDEAKQDLRIKAVPEILAGILPGETLTQHALADAMAHRLSPGVSVEEHDKRVKSHKTWLNDGAKIGRPEHRLIGAYVREATGSGRSRLWGLPPAVGTPPSAA